MRAFNYLLACLSAFIGTKVSNFKTCLHCHSIRQWPALKSTGASSIWLTEEHWSIRSMPVPKPMQMLHVYQRMRQFIRYVSDLKAIFVFSQEEEFVTFARKLPTEANSFLCRKNSQYCNFWKKIVRSLSITCPVYSVHEAEPFRTAIFYQRLVKKLQNLLLLAKSNNLEFCRCQSF